MIKSYTEIPGWFNYEDFYFSIASDHLKNESVAIEVGVWMGRSICFLGEQLKIRNKNPRIYAVDTFKGSENEEEHQVVIREKGGSILSIFNSNIKDLNLENLINPIEAPSEEASKLFSDESIDFVFIDANHEYLHVLEDLRAWYPKVKTGEIIAGHDFWHPDVRKAVHDFFKEKNKEIKPMSVNCWMVKK